MGGMVLTIVTIGLIFGGIYLGNKDQTNKHTAKPKAKK